MLYPLFLNLRGLRVAVIGGGPVALRKVDLLLTAGAKVRLVSPSAVPELSALARKRKLVWIRRPYAKADITQCRLVFACTDSLAVNRRVLKDSEASGILAQSATDPVKSVFHVPSLVTRGDLQIAISTGGSSPALARLLRERVEKLLPEGFDRYVTVLDRIREWQLAQGELSEENARKFRRLVRSSLERQILSGDIRGAGETLNALLGPGVPVRRLLRGLQ